MSTLPPDALDTSVSASARVIERWRSMTPRERLEQVVALNDSCERISEAGVRTRHPLADDDEVRLRVRALRLGREAMRDIYGWDPAIEGW